MTKRSIQSLGAQEVDVTVIPADLFRQDLSNPDDPILDFQDRAIRARRLILNMDGFNAGTPGYRTVKTYTQSNAKPAMILLAPVYTVTSLPKTGFMGTVYRGKGSKSALHISEKYDVICVTAYNTAKLVCTGSNPGVRIIQTTYKNTGYYALYFPSTSENRITLDGLFWGDPIEISDATGYPVTEVSYNLGPYSIVETGSNTNGNWIKFSDGTMICYKRIVETRSVSNPEKDVNFGTTSGYLYTYNDSSPVRLFPQQFIDGSVPIVVSQNDKPQMMWVISNSKLSGMITNTGFGVQFIHWMTDNTVFEGMFIAIGRWKQ